MVRIVFREIVILILCLALFPVAVIAFFAHTDSLSAAMTFLARLLASRGMDFSGAWWAVLVRIFAPYVALQSVRAFFWSQRSITGRRWANLYFAVLLSITAGWSFREAWDLFSFMYALGDIPGELIQFIEIELNDLLILVASLVLAVHCLRIFVNPAKKPREWRHQQR